MQDNAETGQLATLLNRVGEGLDNYLKFEHDDAIKNASTWQKQLDIPLPKTGIGIDATTQELIDTVIQNGSAIPKPGATSYITTGAVTASTLATTAANIASPQRYQHTAFNLLEEVSLNWLAKMFKLDDMQGVYSSGGSTANLIALGGARQSAYEQIGFDASADGIPQKGHIYASAECHHTIQRSAGVLGLGRKSVICINCNNKGQMLPEFLLKTIKQDISKDTIPIAIVANLGTTNTGAIDPISEIAQIARQYNIWLHLDGAYGLPGILDDRLNAQYQGIEYADSVIVDPHKWLGASVGIAATFVKDRDVLLRAFTQEPADYLEGSIKQTGTELPKVEHSFDGFGIPYFDYGVELSAPARGVVVWAMIKEIGEDGMTNRVKRHNDMANYLGQYATDHPNLELLLEPTLSICCFRYVPTNLDPTDTNNTEALNLLNQRLHRQLIRENVYLPSTTQVNGKLAIRPCYVGARTEQKHVVSMLKDILRIGERLTNHQ